MNSVDLIFTLQGHRIPSDHGYALYGAACRIVPALHQATSVGVFPICGQRDGSGGLVLNEHSNLRIRIPQDRVREMIALAGKALELEGSRLRVGVPRIAPLIPACALSSRLVVIAPSAPRTPGASDRGERPKITPEWFSQSATQKLKEMGLASPRVSIPLIVNGPRAGERRRRIVRIKGQTYAGYAMVVEGLSAEESVLLQEQGLGGRRLMGCGLFLPKGSDERI